MRIIAAATIVLCLIGCTQLRNKPAAPPKFPDAATVDRVEAVDGRQLTSDRQEIGRFISEIRNIRSGWSVAWDTYPTPQKSVFLKDKNNRVLCRVDFGPHWIGSDCGQAQGAPPSAKTSSAQDQYFQAFIDTKLRP